MPTLVSIIQVYDAGLGSLLPAVSIARTSNVCKPGGIPETVSGVTQVLYTPPSTRHSNIDPPSVDANVKVADVEFVALIGCVVIVVSGGVVSAHAAVVPSTMLDSPETFGTSSLLLIAK